MRNSEALRDHSSSVEVTQTAETAPAELHNGSVSHPKSSSGSHMGKVWQPHRRDDAGHGDSDQTANGKVLLAVVFISKRDSCWGGK